MLSVPAVLSYGGGSELEYRDSREPIADEVAEDLAFWVLAAFSLLSLESR